MLLRVQHETKLTYSAPVYETVFEVRMAPPSDEDQTALSYRLRTSPQAPVTSFRDGYGNRVDLFNVATPYRELVVHATSFVRVHRRPVGDRLKDVAWPARGTVAIEAMEFLRPSPLVDHCPELDEFVAGLPQPSGSLAEAVAALVDAVRDRLEYEKQVTTDKTPVSEALKLGRGVCQDFAHLFLGACRGLGLPARYVSGYVNHPGEIATHAWCQVWAGDRAGWVDIDPTSGEEAAADHVVIAVGRDYSDVPPNRGLWKGKAEETIAVSVQVEPVDRVPMEWNEWARPLPGSFPPLFQSQRQGGPHSFQMQTQSLFRPRPAYPDQPRSRSGLLHQQQGQQQQQ